MVMVGKLPKHILTIFGLWCLFHSPSMVIIWQ